jgi:hypothetical protein
MQSARYFEGGVPASFLNIIEAGLDAGFQDPSHFARIKD